jgi:hypothetical protein
MPVLVYARETRINFMEDALRVLCFPWTRKGNFPEKVLYIFLATQVVATRAIELYHGKISLLLFSFCVPFSENNKCSLVASSVDARFLDLMCGLIVFHTFYYFICQKLVKLEKIKILLLGVCFIPAFVFAVIDGGGFNHVFEVVIINRNSFFDISSWRAFLWAFNCFLLVYMLVRNKASLHRSG